MDVLTTFLDACRGDPRKRSMFLVQLQSFSGPRELCIIANEMGPYIAGELKKGANVVDLYFETAGEEDNKGPPIVRLQTNAPVAAFNAYVLLNNQARREALLFLIISGAHFDVENVRHRQYHLCSSIRLLDTVAPFRSPKRPVVMDRLTIAQGLAGRVASKSKRTMTAFHLTC